jgi:hypothetical protein
MKLSFKLRDWEEFCNSGSYSPKNVILFLESDFGDFYLTDAAVWEGYSLGEHTIMVIRQFERYFSDQTLPGGLEPNVFRLILALHDIGKPEAISKGGKWMQHKYTLRIIEKVFTELGIKKEWKELAKSLISCDPLGKYLRDKRGREQTEAEIIHMAEQSGQTSRDFFNLLLIFYKVDAGSYTLDAGGLKSLDFIFQFDHAGMQMDFARPFKKKIELLDI